MEKQKRVYPNSPTNHRLVCGVLIVLSVLIFLDGVFRHVAGNGFQLEYIPEETVVPLEERFDETMTETVVELPKVEWYALQVAVFESADHAEKSAEAFRKRGAAGYLWEDGRFRVLAAVYPDREDAQLVREQLSEQHGIDSYLYPIQLPAYTLRIKGMQGQLEIFQAAFGHFDDLIHEMQKVSVELDRQEITVPEMMDRMNALRTQLDVVSLRLQQRFPKPLNETVQMLVDGMNRYAQFVSSVSDEESTFAAGMKLKYQVFSSLSDLKSVYETLGNT